jgi:isopenicillin N synthase-like dioxygenase
MKISQVPIIDISGLVKKSDDLAIASQIGQACRECGFFYIVGHGVDEKLQQRLEQLSRSFSPRIWKLSWKFAWLWVVKHGGDTSPLAVN